MGDDDELAAPAPAAPAAPAARSGGGDGGGTRGASGCGSCYCGSDCRGACGSRLWQWKTAGTLRITHSSLWGGLESIHPHSPAYWDPPTIVLYDRLINTNAQGIPGGELLASWEVDDTLQKWTFDVRQGVTFSDGSPYTSADVAYTIRSLLDPETGSQIASALNMVDVDAMETPDDNTIVLNLTQKILELPLLMKHRRIRVIPDGFSFGALEATPNGTGPFTAEHLSIDGVSIFNSRDDYWQGTPGLAQITVAKIA